jgi:hypothetical protein
MIDERYKMATKEDSRLRARELPTWLENFLDLRPSKDGVALSDLAEIAGVSKQMVRVVITALVEPIEYRTIGKQKHSIFSVDDLKNIAKLYQKGFRYRAAE